MKIDMKIDMKIGMKKGILFCAIIGLVSLGALVGQSILNTAEEEISGQPAASQKASEINVWNNARHKVYVRIEYVDPGFFKKTPAADYFYLEAGQSWNGGKQAQIKGVTGYIYLPTGRADLAGYKRDNVFGDAKNSRKFEIKEIQGFWGNYQVYAQ